MVNRPRPSVAKLPNRSAPTPTGARRITWVMSHIDTSDSPAITVRRLAAAGVRTTASPTPSTSANTISPSMSPLAAAAMGLVGIICTRLPMPGRSATWMFGPSRCAAVAISSSRFQVPGAITLTSRSPSATAIADRMPA